MSEQLNKRSLDAVLQEFDNHLAIIVAAINSDWDFIEESLYGLFHLLLDSDWATSRSIYFVHQNHRARREMIQSLATSRGIPDLKEFTGLMRRVGKAASKRNAIAHGTWETVTHPEMKSGELRRFTAQTTLGSIDDSLGESDLMRVLDQFRTLKMDLVNYKRAEREAKRVYDFDHYSPPQGWPKPPSA